MIDAKPLRGVQGRFRTVAQTKTGDKMVAENRKAFHDYFIEERFETGIVLTGTEIKSARMGKVQLRDAYAEVLGTEVWLMNAHFSPYSHGNIWNHEPTKKRKLLLNRQEIRRLIGKTRQKGLTLVPLKMYLKNGWLKCELALVRGKKMHDKREAIQEREQDREARAAMNRRNLKFHE
jgi:SsrA-binding protein